MNREDSDEDSVGRSDEFGFGGWTRRCCKALGVLTLCAALLTGCAGAGLQSTFLAGPSWQERDARRLQQEGDDLGERIEEAEEEKKKYKRQMRAFYAVLIGLLALSYVIDEEKLTFDAASDPGEHVEGFGVSHHGAVRPCEPVVECQELRTP